MGSVTTMNFMYKVHGDNYFQERDFLGLMNGVIG